MQCGLFYRRRRMGVQQHSVWFLANISREENRVSLQGADTAASELKPLNDRKMEPVSPFLSSSFLPPVPPATACGTLPEDSEA